MVHFLFIRYHVFFSWVDYLSLKENHKVYEKKKNVLKVQAKFRVINHSLMRKELRVLNEWIHLKSFQTNIFPVKPYTINFTDTNYYVYIIKCIFKWLDIVKRRHIFLTIIECIRGTATLTVGGLRSSAFIPPLHELALQNKTRTYIHLSVLAAF